MRLNQENAWRENRGHEISHMLVLIFLLLTGTTQVLKCDRLYLSHKTPSPPAQPRQMAQPHAALSAPPTAPAPRGACSGAFFFLFVITL